MTLAEKLEQHPNCERWTKYGKDRIYVNDIPELLGFRISFYNTGNISSVRLVEGSIAHEEYGETSISNSRAKRIGIWGKLWYDVPSESWQGRDLGETFVEPLIEKLKNEVAEPVA
ncbi:MAG: hypothetical protein GVY18_05170 [Bacteroidetes bacterium]|jgi:hypothetical protein|nr:hypothetical protein [Bacteroidota bacterium]